MPTYLVSGTNQRGQQVVERIDASSATVALETMKQLGYREIELKTDDLMVAYSGGSTNARRKRRRFPPAWKSSFKPAVQCKAIFYRSPISTAICGFSRS